MTLYGFLIFLVGAAIGSYFQTLIGFSLGMVVMAVTVTLGVTAFAETALALNILILANAAVVLPKVWREIDWSGAIRSLGGLVPGVLGGVLLLNKLSTDHRELLQLLIGALIIGGTLPLFVWPRPRSARSGTLSFALAGAASGLLGGLFSVGGPPMVYHYYRQPSAVTAIRATLITSFALLSIGRLFVVAACTRIDLTSVQSGLLAVPVVTLSSWLCARFPPPISTTLIRRIAFILLTSMGAFIITTEILTS